jgi:hypothetical protein
MDTKKNRLENEFPQCIAEWGWKFHHLGIPTNEEKENEQYVSFAKVYTSGFSTSPFGVEWMRWEDDSSQPEIVKKLPHLAFVVENLDWELANRNLKVITPPNPPSVGVRVAMIEMDGISIELMEFEK